MAFNRKEQSLLKDLQNEEKNCAEKYRKAAEAACDPTLKQIFTGIEKAEQGHYDTVTQMLAAGEAPVPKQGRGRRKGQGGQQTPKSLRSKAGGAGKQADAFLLTDLLATEKYVSGVYNTAVFEFSDAAARQALGAIQQQEQYHGKQLADYMQANGMYC